MKRLFQSLPALLAGLAAGAAHAQIPDLLNSLDPGSPSFGAAGAFDVTAANTFSTFYNPAGLGYLRRRTLGVGYRNLPSSRSTLTGNFSDPAFDTSGERGSNAFTHLGYAQPLGGGTLGISYTVGGYVEDLRTGNGLGVGGLTLNGYAERVRARTNLYTLAYGRTNSAATVSYGVGLVLASQDVENRVVGTLTDGQNNSPFSTTDINDTGTGVGAIVGAQFSPPRMANSSFGVSVRTPISIGNNGDAGAIYSRIPGVLRGGYARRLDGVRRGKEDFLVYGVHIAHYFGGEGSAPLDRTNATTFGVGAEYSLFRGSAIVPLRLGYLVMPKGGNGFTDRSAFTLGIGYRPADSRFGLDVNYAIPRRGGSDLAITASYRFDK